MASRIGTEISTIVLGILFILPGIVKTVRLNSTLYREMQLKTFKSFTEVTPLRIFGIAPSPLIYMQSTGVFELIFGTTLVVGARPFKKLACLGVMALMLVTSYCQLSLRDFDAVIVPCGYFCLFAWLYLSLGRLDSPQRLKSD